MGTSDTSSLGSTAQDKTVSGVVVKALPNTLFEIETASGHQFLAYLAGKMRINRIRVLVGDRVEVVLDSYGGKGRIIKRL